MANQARWRGEGLSERWFVLVRDCEGSPVVRPPRKGEWFLSGAIPTAYRAPNDLSTRYHILQEVELVECPCCKGTGSLSKSKE